jgi:hypothetical protein
MSAAAAAAAVLKEHVSVKAPAAATGDGGMRAMICGVWSTVVGSHFSHALKTARNLSSDILLSAVTSQNKRVSSRTRNALGN